MSDITDRQREFQHMVLKSQADGAWGEKRRLEAIEQLRRFHSGEDVPAPWRDKVEMTAEQKREQAHKKGIENGWLETNAEENPQFVTAREPGSDDDEPAWLTEEV